MMNVVSCILANAPSHKKAVVSLCCLTGMVMLAGCSESVKEAAVDAEHQARPSVEQTMDIKLDIKVNETGSAIEAIPSEGQADRGIFTKAAIKAALGKTYPVKNEDGKPQVYWLREVSVSGGKVKALDAEQ